MDSKERTEGMGKLIDIYELNDYEVEAVFEPIPDAQPRFITVNRGKQMSPANAYILATDFAGEFWISLYREDPDGDRTLLWGDDYIMKYVIYNSKDDSYSCQ